MQGKARLSVRQTTSTAFPPTVWRLGWVSLLADVAGDMVYPLLPALLVALAGGATGSPAVSLGLVEGIGESVGALVKWWAGVQSDVARRRKPFVVLGYVIAALSRPLLALVTAPFQVVAVRAIDRTGKGVRSAPRDALVTAAIDEKRRGLAFGFERMMDNIGAVIGPLIAFALARGAGWPLRHVLAASLVPGVLSVLVVLTVREEPRTAPEPAQVAAPARSPRLSRRVRAYLAVVALFTLGASADSFLLLRLVDLGMPAAWTPIAWLSLNLSKALLNLPGGWLSDRLGRKRTLAVAWVVYAAAYALFPLTRSVAVTWALFVFYGAYYGLAEGGQKAIVADLCSPTERGRAFGALHAITGVAVLPANAIFGALYAAHVGWAFGASAACALASAVALLAV